LREYAARYATVEIDQWFWSSFGDSVRLPDSGEAQAYRRSVPADFRFTVKAPNSITLTHLRTPKGEPLVANPRFLSTALFETFLARIHPLLDVLGPVMFQFEYLNRKKMPSQERFQELLETFTRQLPKPYLYGVEVRNANYLNPPYCELLARNKLVPVLLQGYWMPPVVEVYERCRAYLTQQPVVVIRLHGPDRQEIEEETGKQWDQIVAPKDQELGAIVSMVKELVGHGVDVYLNVNNHYEGSAPRTIERIERLLQP
jgi:uncharacterized protein YecE (DUF72 family)